MPKAMIGISGWRYPPWRGVFYPKGLRQADELAYAAARLTSIEINGSFYSLQRPSSWLAWHDSTPDDFVFAVKGPRFITHMKRMRDVEAPLANFFASGPLGLRAKLGCLLWQFPGNLPFDPELFDGFLSLLPKSTAQAAAFASRREVDRMRGREQFRIDVDRPLRHSFEPRHPSWDCQEFREILTRHGAAAVLADTARVFPVIDMQTDGFRYARLHGDQELYTSGYDDAALDRWAGVVRGWLDSGRDAYVYFDNDAKVRAPFDALGLISRLDAAATT
jgi:uncharacterized protein YecE (DUF72 family)